VGPDHEVFQAIAEMTRPINFRLRQNKG